MFALQYQLHDHLPADLAGGLPGNCSSGREGFACGACPEKTFASVEGECNDCVDANPLLWLMLSKTRKICPWTRHTKLFKTIHFFSFLSTLTFWTSNSENRTRDNKKPSKSESCQAGRDILSLGSDCQSPWSPHLTHSKAGFRGLGLFLMILMSLEVESHEKDNSLHYMKMIRIQTYWYSAITNPHAPNDWGGLEMRDPRSWSWSFYSNSPEDRGWTSILRWHFSCLLLFVTTLPCQDGWSRHYGSDCWCHGQRDSVSRPSLLQ